MSSKQKIKNYTWEFISYKEGIQIYKPRIAFWLYKMIERQNRWETTSKICAIKYQLNRDNALASRHLSKIAQSYNSWTVGYQR